MRDAALTQYSVEFPDQPAIHAKLNRMLLKERIPYKAVVTVRVGGKATIQFLAPKNNALRAKLALAGVSVREEVAFELEIPHHPWELHKLAKSLADQDINIISLYTKVEGDNMRIILSVDQTANAMALMRKLGFQPDFPVSE